MGFIGMQFYAQTTSIIGIGILAFCLVDNRIDINFVFSILRNDDRYLAISGKSFAVHLLTHIRNPVSAIVHKCKCLYKSKRLPIDK